MMDRAAAHAALDALLDHLDRARTADSPEAHVAAEAEAHEAWQRLAAGVAGQMILRRLGAARHGRRPEDPTTAHPAAEAAAREPVRAEWLGNPENAVRARLVLAQFLLDHAGLLPPGLANNAVAALWMLDQGEAMGLAKPYWIPHAPKARGRRQIRDCALLALIYYTAGYRDCSVERAAESVLTCLDGPRGEREVWQKAWARIQRTRTNRGLVDHAKAQQETGAKHRQAGAAFSPDVGPHYSVEAIERLPDL